MQDATAAEPRMSLAPLTACDLVTVIAWLCSVLPRCSQHVPRGTASWRPREHSKNVPDTTTTFCRARWATLKALSYGGSAVTA